MVRHGETVAIDRVAIHPGDVIVADRDGVVVVPLTVAREVVGRARTKAADEAEFHAAVGDGLPVMDALRRFDVL
jgi:regulator of RNase E activity RraA